MNPEKLIKLTTTLTLVAVFLLFSSKLVVWYFTGSVSLLAATIDNIGDFLASLLAFFAVRYAMKPADDGHRWGHSKIEPITSLALGMFVSGAAAFLIIESISKIGVSSHIVVMPEAVIGVMIFSIILTGLLVVWQRYVARKTDSTIIHSDSIHYQMDFMLNIAVIVAVLLQPIWYGFDILFGLFIASYILWHTYHEIIMPSFEQLMDAELNDHDKEQIVTCIENNPQVISYHDLRTRRSGRNRFVQVHLDLDQNLSLFDAHEIGDQVMESIQNLFHQAEVIVHLDPIDRNQEN